MAEPHRGPLMRRPISSALLISLLLCAACGAPIKLLNRATPLGGTPITDLTVNDVPVHGFEVTLTLATSNSETQDLSGELLAVDRKRIWLMVDKQVVPNALSSVKEANLVVFPSTSAGWLGLWMGVGAVSTISHGFFLVLTVPMWLGSGIPSIVTSALRNDLRVPLHRLDELSQFARYPAGMPPPWGVLRGSSIEDIDADAPISAEPKTAREPDEPGIQRHPAGRH